MKKLFKGYTLAEVLLTLAIVGVIASLTLPRLIQSTSKVTLASNLARGVELLQAGTTNLIYEAQKQNGDEMAVANLAVIQFQDLFTNAPNGVSNLDFLADENHMFEYGGSFFNTERAGSYNINSIRDYNGDTLTGGLLASTIAYSLKKSKVVIIAQNFSNNVANAEDDEVLTRIFIDANGAEAPNRVGKDIFLFGLANNGHLIPAGTEAYNNNIYGENIALHTVACTNNNITNGLACAGRVMADKWKINY